MTEFDTYTLDTVPEAGRETLDAVNSAYGFVPNLLGTMIESPAVANAYLEIGKAFATSSFNETERQVVLLTTSRVNGCEYCVSAHSVIAGMQKVPADVVDAIRDDQAITDARLEALRQFTVKVVEKRALLNDNEVDDFIAAGFTRAQVLEVILGVAMKTLSNYTNHVAETPLDAAFAGAEWHRPSYEAA